MGAIADALAALKEVLLMRGDIDRLAKNVDKLATMVEIASKRAAAAPRLPKK
jgi:hypothetical protein